MGQQCHLPRTCKCFLGKFAHPSSVEVDYWKEGEEQDDDSFLDLEQALWDEMYPDQARLRKELEGDEVEECEVGAKEDEVGPEENEEGQVLEVIDLGKNEKSSVDSHIIEGEEESESEKDRGC